MKQNKRFKVLLLGSIFSLLMIALSYTPSLAEDIDYSDDSGSEEGYDGGSAQGCYTTTSFTCYIQVGDYFFANGSTRTCNFTRVYGDPKTCVESQCDVIVRSRRCVRGV